MTTTLGAPARRRLAKPTTGRTGWFAGFWRWHFYASVLVIPVLAVLAATGLVYLFRFQLEPALNPDLMRVPAPPAGTRPAGYDQQLRIVEEALASEGRTGAVVATLTEPLTVTTPARFTVTLPDESTRDYFVDPHALRVLGSVNPDETLSGRAMLLHRELMAGTAGAYVMELGTCWAIVMALTGYYLFVKGWRSRRRACSQARSDTRRMGRMRTPVGDPVLRQRHALVGAVAGIAVLGLLVSGLPWTALWGNVAQKLATAGSTSLWADDHGALSKPATTMDEALPHSHVADLPWALGEDRQPSSVVGTAAGSIANLDTAVAVAHRAGLARPYTIVLPEGSDGVFSVIAYARNAPSQERSLHIDRYGGTVISGYGYDDYSALAKTVSHGIALHEGRHFGTVNLILSAGLCVAILFLCVSGPLLWWRRRPRGTRSVGAPRARLPLKTTPALAAGVVALGLFLPLFGISLALILLADRFVLRRMPVLAAWFDVKP